MGVFSQRPQGKQADASAVYITKVLEATFKMLTSEKDQELVAKLVESVDKGFIMALLHDKHTLIDLSANGMNQTVQGELAKTPIFNAFVVKSYDRGPMVMIFLE